MNFPLRREFTGLKGNVTEMEKCLSVCTDDIVLLQAKLETMSKELIKLENKRENLESRSRRNNLRIVGVPEENILSPTDVSTLLLEAFELEKEPLTARARAAFNEVRRLLRGMQGVRFGIIHPARLRITYEGVQHDFVSPEKAKAYIQTITTQQ
ncbi:unnamed protein product [Menidia menidia]|uniref:(Atlantic silverside) hypothetical protein n=1 Tax=Menidia menidia TaxID=238744 RepID=A0A8S4AR10_9TELE|nr:unnamed protein product [Menidia menidia]